MHPDPWCTGRPYAGSIRGTTSTRPTPFLAWPSALAWTFSSQPFATWAGNTSPEVSVHSVLDRLARLHHCSLNLYMIVADMPSLQAHSQAQSSMPSWLSQQAMGRGLPLGTSDPDASAAPSGQMLQDMLQQMHQKTQVSRSMQGMFVHANRAAPNQ